MHLVGRRGNDFSFDLLPFVPLTTRYSSSKKLEKSHESALYN